ncbi:hypothetical protein E2320_002187, partial [Naja naja]
ILTCPKRDTVQLPSRWYGACILGTVKARILGQQTKIIHKMTSITSTVVKTRKKPTQTTATAITSPSTQRSIEGMPTMEKTSATMNTQTMS